MLAEQVMLLSHDMPGQLALMAFAAVMLAWTIFVVSLALRPMGDNEHALERAADIFAERMTRSLQKKAAKRPD